jgi:YggT family protein
VNALIFLIDTFAGLYLLTFVLRLMLQVARADFYHPIPQLIVRITNPLVVPARRMIPSVRRFDFPTLVVIFLLQLALTFLLDALRGFERPLDGLLWFALFELLDMTIWVYLICILIYIVLSWFGQSYHPLATFAGQVIKPVLRPVRRLLPAAGGLDLSPMIASIFLVAGLILLDDLRVLLG